VDRFIDATEGIAPNLELAYKAEFYRLQAEVDKLKVRPIRVRVSAMDDIFNAWLLFYIDNFDPKVELV